MNLYKIVLLNIDEFKDKSFTSILPKNPKKEQ